MNAIKNNKQFNDLVKSGKPFMLDFYADWCGPCQSLLPSVKKLAAEFKDEVEVLKVNVDHQRDLAAKFLVRSIPALFYLKGNKIYHSSKGMVSENEMRKQLVKLSKR